MTNEIEQLQMIEQHLQHLLIQKQSMQSELIETKAMIEQLNDDSVSYVMLGNIMVKKDASVLKKDLKEREEHITVRLSSFGKQEQQLQEKKKELQDALLQQKDSKTKSNK